jgi:flagellar biosynthesis protein FliP
LKQIRYISNAPTNTPIINIADIFSLQISRLTLNKITATGVEKIKDPTRNHSVKRNKKKHCMRNFNVINTKRFKSKTRVSKGIYAVI